jgi:hypothetical protein
MKLRADPSTTFGQANSYFLIKGFCTLCKQTPPFLSGQTHVPSTALGKGAQGTVAKAKMVRLAGVHLATETMATISAVSARFIPISRPVLSRCPFLPVKRQG